MDGHGPEGGDGKDKEVEPPIAAVAPHAGAVPAPAPNIDPLAAELPPEVLKALPEEVRTQFSSFIGMSGPRPIGPDRLLDRIPAEQAGAALSQILETSRYKLDRELARHKESCDSRDKRQGWNLVFAGCVLLVMAGVVVLCIVQNKDSIASNLISGLGGLVAGGLGGYGLGARSTAD